MPWTTPGLGISADVVAAIRLFSVQLHWSARFMKMSTDTILVEKAAVQHRTGPQYSFGTSGHIFGKSIIAVVSHDGELLIMDHPKYRWRNEMGPQHVW
ncbi:MAG: hypothetical protein ACJ8AW_11315 [Rhodopila sp.]